MNLFSYKKCNLSINDTGKGKTIVLIHGFLENKKMWDFYIDSLSSTNRVIVIDLFGHGLSDSLGYVHSMEDMAEAVLFVLKKLKIKKASFVGHSMGGYVALAFAELFPEKVKKIMLLNSTYKKDDEIRINNRNRAVEAVKINKDLFIQLAISNLFNTEYAPKIATEIEFVKSEAIKTSLQGVIAAIEGMKIRKDRSFLILENRFPFYIVLGEKDSLINCHEIITELKNTNANVFILSNGHMSHIENKIEVATILKDFAR